MVRDKDGSRDERVFEEKDVSLETLLNSFSFIPGWFGQRSATSGNLKGSAPNPDLAVCVCESIAVLDETLLDALPNPYYRSCYFEYETRFNYQLVAIADRQGAFIKEVSPTESDGSAVPITSDKNGNDIYYIEGQKTSEVIKKRRLRKGFAVVVKGHTTIDFYDSYISSKKLEGGGFHSHPPIWRGGYSVEIYPFCNPRIRRSLTAAQYLQRFGPSSAEYILAAALSIHSAPMSVIRQYGERRKGALLFECALRSTNADLRRKASVFFTERADYERADALLKK